MLGLIWAVPGSNFREYGPSVAKICSIEYSPFVRNGASTEGASKIAARAGGGSCPLRECMLDDDDVDDDNDDDDDDDVDDGNDDDDGDDDDVDHEDDICELTVNKGHAIAFTDELLQLLLRKSYSMQAGITLQTGQSTNYLLTL